MQTVINLLLFSDLHIDDANLAECELVLSEILKIANINNVSVLGNLGDTFHTRTPSSKALDLYCKFTQNFLSEEGRVIVNIAADSHESTTQKDSILNHFEMLNPKIRIKKEYIDKNNYLYLGHFITTESSINYGATKSVKDLKIYRRVFLGHQHSFQQLGDFMWHLGSCRWVNFDEAKDEHKKVCLIQGYCSPVENIAFVALTSPYSMKEYYVVSNAEKVAGSCSMAKIKGILDHLDSKTKVKVKIGDFEAFKSFLPLEPQYVSKFNVFKRENDFETILQTKQAVKKEGAETLKESLNTFLKQNEVHPEIKNILKQELE